MLEHLPWSDAFRPAVPKISRRNMLRAGAGVITMMGCGGVARAAESHIKSTYGSGFCNLNFYLTNALQTAQEDGLILDFVPSPTFAEQVTFLGAGQVDAGLMPYTSFVALYDAGAPVKIVAGGGIEGCVLVAQPGLDSPAKLKGKTLGTFQLDTLEVLPYDWFKKNGVPFKDVTVRYMGNTPEAVEAFRAGALDMICTIEPYGTALLNDVKGCGEAIGWHRHLWPRLYGLRARRALRPDHAEPGRVEGADQGHDEGATDGGAGATEDARYPGGPILQDQHGECAKIAMHKQPSVVDARNQDPVHFGPRASRLPTWATSRRSPGCDAIDWTLAGTSDCGESRIMYGKLQRKSA